MKTIIRFFLLILMISSVTACATAAKKEQKTKEETPQAAAAEVKPTAPEKPVTITPPPVELEAVHIVQVNETLGKIAKLPQVYGSTQMWPVIFEANRPVLRHPSKIYPGQKLRIPRDAEEIKKLQEQAKVNEVIKIADQARLETKAALPVEVSKVEAVPAPAEPVKEVTPVVSPIRTRWESEEQG